MLDQEQSHQHRTRQRHHGGFGRASGDLEAFDGGEHRNGRGDDAIAVKKCGSENGPQHDGGAQAWGYLRG